MYGYHGDRNEPVAAALTFVLIWALFTLLLRFINQNVDFFFSRVLTFTELTI